MLRSPSTKLSIRTAAVPLAIQHISLKTKTNALNPSSVQKGIPPPRRTPLHVEVCDGRAAIGHAVTAGHLPTRAPSSILQKSPTQTPATMQTNTLLAATLMLPTQQNKTSCGKAITKKILAEPCRDEKPYIFTQMSNAHAVLQLVFVLCFL